MPGPSPRSGFSARIGSSARRGGNCPPGVPGVYRLSRPRIATQRADLGAPGVVPVTGPVYWYDAADASTSDWSAHSGAGSLLTATGTPTLDASAINGQPGVRLDTSEHYGGSETSHLFASGLTFLLVVKMGANPGSFVQMTGGANTDYELIDLFFGEFTLSYTDDSGSTVTATYNAPSTPVSLILEATIGPTLALKFAGVTQTPTSSSGSAGSTSEATDFLQIGNAAQSPTVCELMVFDAGDSGLSAARSDLAAKYALTA